MNWNERRWDIFMLIIVVTLMVSVSFLFQELENEREEIRSNLLEIKKIGNLIDNQERYVLYDLVRNETVVKQTKLLGLYSPMNDIYCIDPLQNPWNFSNTDLHEHWHYMIDQDECYSTEGIKESCKVHFCK